jgi:hypothetical protein
LLDSRGLEPELPRHFGGSAQEQYRLAMRVQFRFIHDLWRTKGALHCQYDLCGPKKNLFIALFVLARVPHLLYGLIHQSASPNQRDRLHAIKGRHP